MNKTEVLSILLQKELGYELITQGVNDVGINVWVFRKNGVEIEMNEDNIGDYYIPSSAQHKEMLERAHNNFIELTKSNPLKLG